MNFFHEYVLQSNLQSHVQRCQQELRAVSQHNLTQLRRLAKSAREEMARQEVRNRLAEADREVLRCQIRIWKEEHVISKILDCIRIIHL